MDTITNSGDIMTKFITVKYYNDHFGPVETIVNLDKILYAEEVQMAMTKKHCRKIVLTDGSKVYTDETIALLKEKIR